MPDYRLIIKRKKTENKKQKAKKVFFILLFVLGFNFKGVLAQFHRVFLSSLQVPQWGCVLMPLLELERVQP